MVVERLLTFCIIKCYTNLTFKCYANFDIHYSCVRLPLLVININKIFLIVPLLIVMS